MPKQLEGAGLSAEQLDDLYNPDGDGEHPQITRSMWRDAVAQQDTASGYWQWLAHKLQEGVDAVIESAALRIIEGPEFCAPMNGRAGLYVQVLSQRGRVPAAVLLEFLRNAVKEAGFDPDGEGLVGLPTVRGITARTYGMWFFTRVQPAQVKPADDGPHFVVIQEGGTSTELHLHSFNTAADAEQYRVGCVSDGAYRTSPCIQIAPSLANHPQFYEIAGQLIQAITEIDYAEEPDGEDGEQEEVLCAAK
ncbi:hypothetical protein K2O51_31140 (plasmid) [Cupriavidus pinatubonensis]|uniref:hypothetical protein n=1 Tax=Cupriavidus pinatubonensis TaxID=248026 RepID=UPI001C73BDD0|nr:hypothetical protein [Cupriavidus pinatubonensis]QYY33702.1 hypothetical protein K2O51_31140 [Cupriavidus pinatubonensis]